MIENIRCKLEELRGKEIRLVVDVGRNKYEEYIGTITDTYKKIWLFKTKNDTKSFSYTDILIKTVVISSL